LLISSAQVNVVGFIYSIFAMVNTTLARQWMLYGDTVNIANRIYATFRSV
jgi:hypothetical protein